MALASDYGRVSKVEGTFGRRPRLSEVLAGSGKWQKVWKSIGPVGKAPSSDVDHV